jgi:sugar (glycoside-pentoside-hexuronide) transporter
MTTTGSKLPVSLALAYGTGSLGTALFSVLPGLLLLYFMTDTLGIPAGLAGWAVFVPKAWDVIADPIIGHLSDSTRSSWGRRRPFLLAGALALPVAFHLLFFVPRFDTVGASFAWVLALFLVCATAYATFQIPYVAMPGEMTQNYHERTSLISFRIAMVALGTLLGGAAAPALIELAGGGRDGYRFMSAVLALVCMGSMLVTFYGTRTAPRRESLEVSLGWKERLRVALANRPFLVLSAAYLLQLVGLGTILAVLPYFVKYRLGAGHLTITLLFALLILPTVVAMPLWVAVSRRVGKQRAYLAAAAGFAVVCGTLVLADASRLPLLYAQVAVLGLLYGAVQLFPFSMLPDTVEVDHARSGLRRDGIFTGAFIAVEKIGFAVGALLVGVLLGLAGFVEGPGQEAAAQPERALWGIRLLLSVGPAALFAASVPLLTRYEVSEKMLNEVVGRS